MTAEKVRSPQRVFATQLGRAEAAKSKITAALTKPAHLAFRPQTGDAAVAAANVGQGAATGAAHESKPTAATAPQPESANGRQTSAAGALLKLESESRKARNLNELGYFIVNEPRQLTRAQQIILIVTGASGQHAVRAVSSITHVDRASPLVLWFEAMASALERSNGLSKPLEFQADAFSTDLDSIRDAYPMRNLLWVPLIDLTGAVIAGMLMTRSTPWTEHDIAIANHLASGFAMTWQAISPKRRSLALPARITTRWAAMTGVALIALALFPVSMSALAPVEVAPRDPLIVTTGVEGVVDKVLVEPNAIVKHGQPLLQLADTTLKNKLEIAEREVLVAQTKYSKSAQLAFIDVRGRHELAQAQAELELKSAERNYARELFERATVKAERDGIALFADKRELIGRPVAVGEKLMEIATPGNTQFHIDLGVADTIVLSEGARIKIFLDSAPLSPLEAKLVRADYQARPRDNQQMAFRLVAQTEPRAPADKPLQFGVRGTAQVYGDTVVLAFYLLRRPIAAARQWIGL